MRYWYVVEDDTPILPERPLELDQAIALFREVVADTDDETTIDIRQCTQEDLDWASE